MRHGIMYARPSYGITFPSSVCWLTDRVWFLNFVFLTVLDVLDVMYI